VGGTTMGRRSGGGAGQEKNCESEGDVPGRVSRYGSDESRHGRTMRAVAPHLFSIIITSSCWRGGIVARTWIGRVEGSGRRTQNLGGGKLDSLIRTPHKKL